jgi:hypothetical protein
MDVRKILYFSVSGFITILALANAANWIVSGGRFSSGVTYLIGVPFVYMFTPAMGLVWFVGHNTRISRKWHNIVWSVLWTAWLLWLYVTIMFFFGTTIEIYQNGQG